MVRSAEDFISVLETQIEVSDLDVIKKSHLAKVKETNNLLTRREGTVQGVVRGWIDDIKPVTESAFGITLSEDPILELGRYALYQPTIFEGVRGRLLAYTIDEIMGPGFSFDITAETPETLEEGPDVWPLAQRLFFNIYMLPRIKQQN